MSQTFEKYNTGISTEEYAILDVLSIHAELCQRDLAKLALRDSVKIGRILDKLEKKNFVERFNDTKGKRRVKKMKLTDLGMKAYTEILQKIEPSTQNLLYRTFSTQQLEDLTQSLNKLHKVLSEVVTIQA